jgi:hypothetical protein
MPELTGQPKTDLFLDELRALLKKHGAHIGGCGCCGSPWLSVADEDGVDDFSNYLKED